MPRRINPQRLAKWVGWIQHDPQRTTGPGSIWSQLVEMTHHRAIYDRLTEILVANRSMPQEYTFFDFVTTNYLTTQALAIRRQADTHKDAATLGRLLYELEADLAGHRDLTADEGLPTFTLDDVQADRSELDQVVAPVKAYVDQRLAHMDRATAQPALTGRQIHDAVAVLQRLFGKYEHALTGAHTPDLEPVIQSDWEAVFRVPWLPTKPGFGDT